LRPKWFFNTSSPITAQPAVVGGVVYVGTYDGKFYAVNAADGTQKWVFDVHTVDNDITDFGTIPGSATVVTVAGRRLVVFGGGGTLFALDAANGSVVGSQCLDRVDTTCQGHAGYTTEIESSPAVIVAPGGGTAQVLVGTDVNEESLAGPAGLVSLTLDAGGFQPRWWFDPEAGQTYVGLAPTQSLGHLTEHGCNDVWSSPAIDALTNTASFGLGNCNHPELVQRAPGVITPALVESTVAVDLTTGSLRWQYAPHLPANGLDVDFGATPNVLAPGLVGEGGKDGHYYAYDSDNGAPLWNVQVATGSSIGGIIASTAVGKFSDGHQAVFAATSIPLSPADIQGSTQHNLLNPTHALGAHAIDATTHTVRWDAPAGPAYGAAVFSGGVVFVPDTFTNALLVLDADTGAILRAQPMNVPPAGPVAVSGSSVYMGSGITENLPGVSTLAALGGLWAFTTTP